jgi:hypothetical protein
MKFTIEPRGEIKTTACFVRAISTLRQDDKRQRKFWYLGLSDCKHSLLPTIRRPQKYAGKEKMLTLGDEIQLLHRFRRRVYPHLGRQVTPGEALFLARHHKLSTRLLDWTANALSALYFACARHLDKNAKVWVMHRPAPSDIDPLNDTDPFEFAGQTDEKALFKFLGPPTLDYLKIIYPFYNSPRLVAQDGAFTVHSDPWKPVEKYVDVDFDCRNLHIEGFYFWCIPAAAKIGIIEELSGLGITERTVYPDLDGLAKSLWETEVLWGADPLPPPAA